MPRPAGADWRLPDRGRLDRRRPAGRAEACPGTVVTGGTFRVLGLVTARGGSKGLPGKNLRLLGGKPLVAWSIEAARESGVLGRVVMSTDDPGL
ncbi:MAG: hypothetical protein FJX57_22000, partial [Alphaproteobacteria bacterium]|nr:hypothetical protein [Alphaproteobacteria bacterium]